MSIIKQSPVTETTDNHHPNPVREIIINFTRNSFMMCVCSNTLTKSHLIQTEKVFSKIQIMLKIVTAAAVPLVSSKVLASDTVLDQYFCQKYWNADNDSGDTCEAVRANVTAHLRAKASTPRGVR